MKIEEAIGILKLDKTCDFEGDPIDLETALQLGIEALKRHKYLQEEAINPELELLPGETKG